ncbi:MAG: hypothetical protein SF162_09960 [bacterium]|nr:hypothetical protein [bacterium]
MDLRLQPGILNTGASLMADLTLLAYILLIVPGMLVGFVFARRKMFEPYHKLTMTTITLINWVLIALVMAVSYAQYVAPQVPAGLNRAFYLLPTLHLVTGAAAQLLGTYLVIRMWFEKQLPAALKVVNIKRYMRLTLALWLITALLGGMLYAAWYLMPDSAQGQAVPPAATEEAPVSTDEPSVSTDDPPVSTPDAVQSTPEARSGDSEAAPVKTPDSPAETPEASA